MDGHITVKSITRPARDRDFMRLPAILNMGDENWVHPLRMAERKLLSRSYPFFHHGDAAFFVAYKSGEPVGRIAAIENRLHNKTCNDQTGFFGFFECEDDPHVARSLLQHAGRWLKAKGLESIRGPLNYSLNDECPGVLYDGFDGIPQILMAYNPRYYAGLLEQAGMAKIKDLYAYLVTRETVAGDRFQRLMKAVRRRAPDMDIREVRLSSKGFREDIRALLDIFNTAWKDNWGFVEVTPPEVDAIAKDLRPIVQPEYTAIAEIAGKPAGMIVCIPNVNEVLHRMGDGRLFPTGWYKLLTGLKTIRTMRTMLMGVVDEYRGRGVDAMLIDRVIQAAWRNGMAGCELSWVLEDNEPMISLADKAGGFLYRKYRLFEVDIDAILAT